MLRPDDFERLVAAYRSDRAMGTAAGPVRDELVEVAKLAAALAELSPTGVAGHDLRFAQQR